MPDLYCPYCQSTSKPSVRESATGWYVECNHCLARGPLNQSAEKAVDGWNKANGHQKLLRTLVDASPDVILVKDEDCRFLMVNKALADLYNTTPEDMIGKTDADFNDNREETEFFDNNVREILARFEPEVVEEAATDQNTGITRYYRSLKQPILLQPGSRKALLVIAHDITDLKQTLLEIAERERRYDYAMDAAGEGIWDWSLSEGKVSHNSTWGEILGFQNVDDHDLEFFTGLIHPEDREKTMQDVMQAINNDGHYESEHRLRKSDGSYIWASDRGRVVECDTQGRPTRMVGSFSDITKRREAEEKLQEVRQKLERTNTMLEQLVRERTSELVTLNRQLEEMVRRDPLTGLANRLAADDKLAEAFTDLKNENRSFALMLIDIDHFKRVNDTFGHQVGDRALCHIARELSAAVQDKGFIARFGGEEFLLLLPQQDEEAARQWAEHLCFRIASGVVPHSDPIHLTISIGLVFVNDTAMPVHEAIRRADEFLYQAKHEGRNCVRPALESPVQTSL